MTRRQPHSGGAFLSHKTDREREFHWKRRKASGSERTVDAIRGPKGKRLMYHGPTYQRDKVTCPVRPS